MSPRFLTMQFTVLLALLGLLPGTVYGQQVEPEIVTARIGLNGVYKLGCWTPLEVDLTGGASAYTGMLIVTVSDCDGVPTQILSPRPIGIEPGKTTTARFNIRIGQVNGTVTTRFVSEGKELAKKAFYPGIGDATNIVTEGLPASHLVMLEFGASLGLGDLINSTGGNTSIIRSVRVENAAELPTKWFGYESIDTVLLATSSAESYRPLLQNPARVNALREWVIQGGRLVVFCGANGNELLSPGGPLEKLIPGDFEPPKKPTKLRQSQPLETFCNAEDPVSLDRKLSLPVSRLTNIRGQILASEGRKETDLPLVIRGQLGFGELLFVAVDFDRPPLRDWSARTSFIKELLQWSRLEQALASNAETNIAYAEDVSNQVRDALESRFEDVEPVSFGLVAFLVLVYILLIGPGDYFLVNKVFRRAELTWLTFPLIVVGVSFLAYWFAHWTKGDQLRVNQIEIVDIDTISGNVRGTAWTHFFSPRVNKYNLTFHPNLIGELEADSPELLVSWLGMTGHRLGGGMQAMGTTTTFDTGYSFSPDLTAMQQLPVQVWSTKTLSARWKTTTEQEMESSLVQRAEELRGSFTNPFDVTLEDAHLIYGRHAYHLGRIKSGEQASINSSRLPRRVKTQLTNATAGESTESRVAEDGTVLFHVANMDVTRLAKLVMFYDAMDGFLYSSLSNHYQSFLDMSGLLVHEDVAILLCRVPGTGSQWHNGEERLRSDLDHQWTYLRIVLPVTMPK